MKNLKKKYKSVLLLLLLTGYTNSLFSQHLSDELYAKLSASDQKKLQNAEDLFKKGSDCEAEYKNSPGENKSRLKRLEAAEFYQKSNNQKVKVYKDNIKSLSKKLQKNDKQVLSIRQIESIILDSLKVASGIRNKAEDEANFDQRVAKLQRSEMLESKAILRLQKVLFTYINYPVFYDEKWIESEDDKLPDSVPIKNELKKDSIPANVNSVSSANANDSSLYEIVKINEDQVDQFNKFLQETYPTDVEKYVIDFGKLDYSDINQLREAWYQYRFGVSDSSLVASADTLENSQDRQQKETILASAENKQSIIPDGNASKENEQVADKKELSSDFKTKVIISEKNNTSVEDNQVSDTSKVASNIKTKSIIPDKKSGTEQTKTSDKKTVASAKNEQKEAASNNIPKVTQTGTADVKNSFIYRVQIAACRVQLDHKVLHDIYDGSEQLVELEEDYWYKYAIGEFTSYSAARVFANESKIPGAFVIAYLNGKRIKLTPAITTGKSSSLAAQHIDPAAIEFRIQVAASKSPIPNKLLKFIYADNKSLKLISENGWYKYSLPAGRKILEARSTLKGLNIPGAFIVAYQKDVKIDLAEAIKLTN